MTLFTLWAVATVCTGSALLLLMLGQSAAGRVRGTAARPVTEVRSGSAPDGVSVAAPV